MLQIGRVASRRELADGLELTQVRHRFCLPPSTLGSMSRWLKKSNLSLGPRTGYGAHWSTFDSFRKQARFSAPDRFTLP